MPKTPKTTEVPKRYDNEIIDLTMSKREMHTRKLMMNKHYNNMRNVKPTINTRDPRFRTRYEKFKRYHQLDNSKLLRERKIKKENEELVGKITKIATSGKKSYRQEYPSKQRMFMTILAEHGRKMRQLKITKENQHLAGRLLKKSSNYDRKLWEKDWQRHDHVLNHLSKSAKMGLKAKLQKKKQGPKSPNRKHLKSRASTSRAQSRKSSDRLRQAGLASLCNSSEGSRDMQQGEEKMAKLRDIKNKGVTNMDTSEEKSRIDNEKGRVELSSNEKDSGSRSKEGKREGEKRDAGIEAECAEDENFEVAEEPKEAPSVPNPSAAKATAPNKDPPAADPSEFNLSMS
eukprot:CAMPEP_0184497810 /NCGR_PEP_ID=MMETSP0113_2-20130426/37468_1 /TAXON_ID=91329 /ORGANISM="Norrisiella sphaerica, Strain BC52" /LENGTH=343 /DNA_ID=CAMNT_0026885071 /DNA_START=443 /DNA_END=1474 /DNA_ORIENTATION=+